MNKKGAPEGAPEELGTGLAAPISYALPASAASQISEDQRRDVVLDWLRCLHGRIRMYGTDIAYIGTSLKSGLVSPEDALDWLDELDPALLDLIGARESVQ